MRAVVVHDSPTAGEQLRRVVLGAGVECKSEDAVSFNDLESRLARGAPDLLLVSVGGNRQGALEVISKAAKLASVRIMAVGPVTNPQFVEQARQAGATQYLDAANMRNEFDVAVEQLAGTEAPAKQRGRIISVFSPTPGSGGATVAINLAGALVRTYPKQVALVEMGRQPSDIALRLDVKPKFTLFDVCQRWERLDATGLANSLTEHRSGLLLLAHGINGGDADDSLSTEAVRRIVLLLRAMCHVSILKLDSALDDEALEAMRLSDLVCLVIRPDVLAVRRANVVRRAMEDAGIPNSRVRLIVNRSGQPGQLRRRQIEENMEMKIFYQIPDDPKLTNLAANQGMLLHELSRLAAISRKFTHLATQLNGKA
jgi:pilus assembly protein CpaE